MTARYWLLLQSTRACKYPCRMHACMLLYRGCSPLQQQAVAALA
jgi:hypothetical protein